MNDIERITGDDPELRPLTFEQDYRGGDQAFDEELFDKQCAQNLCDTLERGYQEWRNKTFAECCERLRVQFPAKTEEQIGEIAAMQTELRTRAAEFIKTLTEKE